LRQKFTVQRDTVAGRVSRVVLQRWPTKFPTADGGEAEFASMVDVFRYLASVPAETAKEVAKRLLKVLLLRDGPPYHAKDEAEVEGSKKVQEALGITFGEWNGLIFEARSRLDPSARSGSEFSSSGTQSATVTHVAEVTAVKDHVAKAGSKFAMIYSDVELDDLVGLSKRLGLNDEELFGIVQTGCRDLKPRSAEQLKDQMYNWKKVVTGNEGQGHPFKFMSIEDFKRFKTSLIGHVRDCTLPGGIKLPTTDIRIQGSSLRTPFAEDVDVAVCVTPEQYRDICAGRYDKHFTKLEKKGDKEPETPKARPENVEELKQLTYEQMTGICKKALKNEACGYVNPKKAGTDLKRAANFILMGKFDGKQATLMKPLFDLTKTVQAEFPDLNIESVTVILVPGPFDLKPALRLDTLEEAVVKQEEKQ
jgi:hypothetical protein